MGGPPERGEKCASRKGLFHEEGGKGKEKNAGKLKKEGAIQGKKKEANGIIKGKKFTRKEKKTDLTVGGGKKKRRS